MACTTLIQSNFRHNRVSALAPISGTCDRFQKTSSLSSIEQDFETNDLESLRENMAEKGLSNTAAQILSQIAEDQALQLITNWPGKNCLAGVVNDRLVRLHAV